MKRLIFLLAALAMSACAAVGHQHAGLSDDIALLRGETAEARGLARDAQETADEALEATREAQACCAANTERLERMFEAVQEAK